MPDLAEKTLSFRQGFDIQSFEAQKQTHQIQNFRSAIKITIIVELLWESVT